MMLPLLGSVAIIALVLWFFLPREPLPKSLNDSPDALAKALEYLCNLGLEGGELRIQARDDNRMTVVVVKHIVALNNIELRATVSDEEIGRAHV